MEAANISGERKLDKRVRAGPAAPAASPIRPFAQSLPMQLLRTREALMQHFRPHLRARGLTDQQWRIVRALAEAESMEIGEVSARCSIHAASLSTMLPKLVAAGIITRRINRSDQRRMMVALTSKGRRLFKVMGAESEVIYRRLRKQIGAERVEALYQLLDEVLTRASPDAASSHGARHRSLNHTE